MPYVKIGAEKNIFNFDQLKFKSKRPSQGPWCDPTYRRGAVWKHICGGRTRPDECTDALGVPRVHVLPEIQVGEKLAPREEKIESAHRVPPSR